MQCKKSDISKSIAIHFWNPLSLSLMCLQKTCFIETFSRHFLISLKFQHWLSEWSLILLLGFLFIYLFIYFLWILWILRISWYVCKSESKRETELSRKKFKCISNLTISEKSQEMAMSGIKYFVVLVLLAASPSFADDRLNVKENQLQVLRGTHQA